MALRLKLEVFRYMDAASLKPQPVKGWGVNLPNVKVEELKRGMVLAEVGSLIPTHLINARLHYLESNSEPLYRRQRVKFYSGTSEAVARVILLNGKKLLLGESALVQFRLEKKLVPVPFDKYIVRSLSPISTIGGGTILETNCRKYRRYDPDTIKQLEVFEKGEHEEIVELLVKKSKYQPLKPDEINQKSGLNRSGAKRVIDILLQRGIIRINGAAIHKEWYEDLKRKVVDAIKQCYQRNPLQRIVPKEELKSKIGMALDSKLYDRVLQDLTTEGVIEVKGGRIRLAHSKASLTPEQELIADKLIKVCRDFGFKPARLGDIYRALNGHKAMAAPCTQRISERRRT
ncbi:MAG: DNA/RNA-binding winged helix domain-containing protein [Actinomycetota bacterium]|nr:DNA/RNA-binding winged helix domain-containing protein [Actinomycetota bacterium]